MSLENMEEGGLVFGGFAGTAGAGSFRFGCFCGRRVCGFGDGDWSSAVGEERSLDENGDRGGEVVGVGNGDGASGFGVALLAGFARVGGIGGLVGVGFVGLSSSAGGGFLALIFVFGKPVIFPAETVEEFFEETAGINMLRGAHTGNEAVYVAFTTSGELVSGFESLAARTATRNNEARINYRADERDAFVDGLAVLLFRVESEVEFAFEEFLDGVDIAEKLFALFGGNDDEEVVDVATIVLVTEVKSDVTVELIEEDVGEELAGEVADDDAATFGLIEKTFADGEFAPIGARSADDDVFHGVVVDDLVPEKLNDLVELIAVAGVAADAVFMIVFFIVERNMRNGIGVIFELALETPANALVEFVMIEAHKIALDVEFDDEGRASVIFSGTADVSGETLLAEEGALADAAGVGVDEKAAVPPVGADVVKEVVDDAVTKRGGDDFADDGIVDDEGDATAGFVAALDDTVAKEN